MSNSKPNIASQNQISKNLQAQQKPIAKHAPPQLSITSQKIGPQSFYSKNSFSSTPQIKDVASIDVVNKANTTSLHLFYILLIVTSQFVMFSYFSSKQKPPTIIYEKITEKSIETRPALSQPEAPVRLPTSLSNQYSGHDFEKDAIIQKIRFEFLEKRNNVFNEYMKESRQYRDTHNRYYETKDYQEINNQFEKKKASLLGEEFAELCKKTSDRYYCKSAQSYDENKENFY